MAEKQGQYETFHPSEVSAIRMAVIEYREDGGHEWMEWAKYDNFYELQEDFLRERCENLARHYPKAEFRYRHGTLTLDPSDKCEIFKSE